MNAVQHDPLPMPTRERVAHWIDGRPVSDPTAGVEPVYDPSVGRPVRHVEMGDEAVVADAVGRATDAAQVWRDVSLAARARVLFAFRQLLADHAPDLAALVTEEHGKTLPDALGEVQRGLEVVDFACGVTSHLRGRFSSQISTNIDMVSFREPLGVVAGITPFNFPVMVPLWMHPIALACGNAFILKPSERDPSPSLLMAELWQRAGLPDGLLNVVQGGRRVVEALIDHPQVAAVSFVGSTPVARAVHERASVLGKRVQALGGAKNHAVVLPDAVLDDVADHLTAAAFGSAGERCMALSVAVVVGDAGDRLVPLLAARAREVRIGPGTDPHTEMGPLITGGARDRIQGIIERADRDGCDLVVDGRSAPAAQQREGFFLGPTLVDRVPTSAEIYREEIFGPVLCVVRAETFDEAIDVVNANVYGNGAAVFTQSGAAAREFQRRVTAGMIGVNVPIPVPAAAFSFGGQKASMFGEHKVYGHAGVDFYTQEKTVTQRWDLGRQAHSYAFPGSD